MCLSLPRISIRFIFYKTRPLPPTNNEKANLIRNWRLRRFNWVRESGTARNYTTGVSCHHPTGTVIDRNIHSVSGGLRCYAFSLSLLPFVWLLLSFRDGFVIAYHFWSQKIRSNSTSKVIRLPPPPCDDCDEKDDAGYLSTCIDNDIMALVLGTPFTHCLNDIRLDKFPFSNWTHPNWKRIVSVIRKSKSELARKKITWNLGSPLRPLSIISIWNCYQA